MLSSIKFITEGGIFIDTMLKIQLQRIIDTYSKFHYELTDDNVSIIEKKDGIGNTIRYIVLDSTLHDAVLCLTFKNGVLHRKKLF